jgi:hypothetical protein
MAKSNAERQAEYRDRKRRELEEEGLPARDIEEEPLGPAVAEVEPGPDERDAAHLLGLPVDAELSAEEEQLLRDHFGYSASERRSRVERASAADGIRRDAAPISPSMTQALQDLQANEDRHADRTQGYRDSLTRKA